MSSLDTTTTPADPRPNLKRVVAKNALFITLGSVALKAINFTYTVTVIRQLGDDHFGQYSTVLAFVGLSSIFAELGVSQYVMREVARHPEKTHALFWNLLVLRLLLAIIGVVGITTVAAIYGFTPALVFGVFIYTLTFIYAAFNSPMEMLMVANERFGDATLMGVILQMSSVMLGAIVLLNNWGFLALLAIGLIAMIPPMLFAIWTVRRRGWVSRPIEVNPREWPTMIRSGLPFGLITLSLTIALGIDTVILARFRPPEDVGWYNAAYRLAQALLFFFTGFSIAIVPTLSKAYVTMPGTVERWYYRSVKIIMLLSIPLAVGGMLVATPLIYFLFGDQYEPAAQVFQIIVWDVPLLMFASFCGNITTVIGQERSAARIVFIGAVANIGLNLLFIPRFGILGAAVITVVTDLIATGQFHFLLRHRLKLPDVKPLLLRIVLASTLMGAVVWLLSHQHLFVQILAGGAVYAALIIALRLLDPEEWAFISRVVNKIRFASSKA